MPAYERKRNRSGVVMLFAVAVFLLAGCSMTTETELSRERVNLRSSVQNTQLETAQVTDDVLYTISEHYRRYGDGDLSLTVTYDSHSGSNTAMNAVDEAARMAQVLRKLGVKNVKTDIMPVKDQKENSGTLLRYNIVTAHAPPGCSLMSGMDSIKLEWNKDYKYGCTIETLLARQIARPRDLAGQTEMPEADARRQLSLIEQYRSGATSDPIKGETVEAQ